MNSVYFNLDEVIFFLKNGDFSFFDFYSDYSEKDAVVYMKGTGCLYICNVSDDVIPEETVRLVIEVLEHLDEDGTLVYTIRIRNVQTMPLPAPTGSGIFSDPYIWIFLTALLLLAAMALPVRRKRRSRMRGGGADD